MGLGYLHVDIRVLCCPSLNQIRLSQCDNSEFRLTLENGGPMGDGVWTAMTSRKSNMEGG